MIDLQIKELQTQKDELITQIHLKQIQVTESLLIKTSTEDQLKTYIDRQNEIFQELKTLERQIFNKEVLSMKQHNEWNHFKWEKTNLEENKDKLKQQIRDLQGIKNDA